MSRLLVLVVGALFVVVAARVSPADEVAAEPTAWEPAAVAAHELYYVDFPRQLQAMDDAIALAEWNVAFWQQRVAGYRPFRSFGRYAATYSADLASQLQLVAAQQELACLVRAKGDLWRVRQLRAAGF